MKRNRALLLIAFIMMTSAAFHGCTRFNELEVTENYEDNPFADDHARIENENVANDPRPYGGIFGEGWIRDGNEE